MKAVDFDYVRPAGVEEVCRLLAEAEGEAKIIAGGQTLVPLLAMRLARPAVIIDINRIAELSGIEDEADAVTVRACTRQADLLADDTIRRRVPLLAKALSFVGHVQTRNRGTLGGSFANADPAAEIGLAGLALDCAVSARSVTGERTIPVTEFFLGPMMTDLTPEECLMAVRFPVWKEGGAVGTGFQEVSIRRSDFALAAAAVQLVLDANGVCRRLALSVGGAGATPVRVDEAAAVLVDTFLEERYVAEAVRIVCATIEAVADLHASAAYRRRIAGAMVARAVAEAREDALRGNP